MVPSTVDMDSLFPELVAMYERLGRPSAARQVEPAGRAAFVAARGFRAGGGHPSIVVGAEVALELGHPDTESLAVVIWTRTPGRVSPGRVSLWGPDLDSMPRRGRASLGLLVALELAEDVQPDPFCLEQLLRLTNRLPGYMVRALPGRLWARVGARQLASGLSLLDVGEALVASYTEELCGVLGVEVLLVTASAEAVCLLGPICTEARIRAGQHKKLTLAPDGSLECDELDCERCDERDTCDSLRDVLARRRESRRAVLATGSGSGISRRERRAT